LKEQGTVKWFNDVRGYGFISREGKPDVFVHYKSIKRNGNERRTLLEGERVEFELEQGRKGAQAVNVTRR